MNPDELVTGAEIARRLGVSRQRVYQWVASGPLRFPPPVQRLKRVVIWRWGDVAAWDERHRKAIEPPRA